MPATNGSRISRRMYSTTTPTSSVSTPHVIWRVNVIATTRGDRSRPRALLVSRDAHVTHPFAQVHGNGGKREDRDRRHQRDEHPAGIEAEAERAEHQADQQQLRR